MTIPQGYRRGFLVAAAFASAVACVVAAIAGPVVAAVIAAMPAILVLASLLAERANRSSSHYAIVDKMVEQAEAGRKMAIYDRSSGLFAYWYMTLRGEEECNRAGRYGCPLALLVVEPAPESNVWAVEGDIALWLRQRTRAVDVAGAFGNGRFLVIMPETGIEQADSAAVRLRGELADARTGVSAFSDDGEEFEHLYAVALDRLNQSIDLVA